jgi:hypothetical protein
MRQGVRNFERDFAVMEPSRHDRSLVQPPHFTGIHLLGVLRPIQTGCINSSSLCRDVKHLTITELRASQRVAGPLADYAIGGGPMLWMEKMRRDTTIDAVHRSGCGE